MTTTPPPLSDHAPLVAISQAQAEAAARVVAGMCPRDAAEILRALGLDGAR